MMWRLSLFLATCSIMVVPVFAQQERVVTVTQVDEKRFPEIELTLEIRNTDGTFQLDAAREAFRVTEYDHEVPILRFEAPQSLQRKPTTIVLVVDHSASMRAEDRIGGMKRAVASFLAGLPEGSRVAVIAFSSEVELICPFTEKYTDVQAAVDELSPMGETRFYDAVAAGLQLIGEEPGRRAVLALTDGIDTKSKRTSIHDVVALARRLSLPVHTLGLGREANIAATSMRTMAESSRGQYYPATDADNLKSIYEEIAQRLRSSYSLTYRSDRPLPDGTLRPVKVYFAGIAKAAEAAVYVRGMVVPAAGWSWLFVLLVAGLAALNWLPARFSRAKS